MERYSLKIARTASCSLVDAIFRIRALRVGVFEILVQAIHMNELAIVKLRHASADSRAQQVTCDCVLFVELAIDPCGAGSSVD